MMHLTVGELDEEIISKHREVAFYIGVEADVKATIFATVRCKRRHQG